LTVAQQEELFGIAFTSINRLYGEFFGHLADKRKPMPQAEAPTVAGLVALLTALALLLTANNALKDQIEAEELSGSAPYFVAVDHKVWA